MTLILRSVVALGFVLLRVIRIFHPKIMCAWELMKSIACFSCYLGHVPTLDFTVMLGVCIVGGFGSSANVTLVFLWESDDVRFMTWLGYPRWFHHVKIFVMGSWHLYNKDLQAFIFIGTGMQSTQFLSLPLIQFSGSFCPLCLNLTLNLWCKYDGMIDKVDNYRCSCWQSTVVDILLFLSAVWAENVIVLKLIQK